MRGLGLTQTSKNERMPPCYGLSGLFYGFVQDGEARKETDRKTRERRAKDICHDCTYEMRCLERALVFGEAHGVWGGMTAAERKDFKAHLRSEGYGSEVPEGDELWAALNAYYRRLEKKSG